MSALSNFQSANEAEDFETAFHYFREYLNHPIQTEFKTHTVIYNKFLHELNANLYNNDRPRLCKILECFRKDANTSTGKAEVCLMNAFYYHIDGDEDSKEEWLNLYELHKEEMEEGINTTFQKEVLSLRDIQRLSMSDRQKRVDDVVNLLGGGDTSPWVDLLLETTKRVFGGTEYMNVAKLLVKFDPLYEEMASSGVCEFDDKSLPEPSLIDNIWGRIAHDITVWMNSFS